MDTTSPQSDSAISAKGQAIPLFPTVCFVVEHENTETLNQELKAYCLEQEQSAAGIASGSVAGGYHSSRQFFDSSHTAIQQLKTMLMDDAKQYLAHYWKQESTTPIDSLGELSTRMSGWSVILRQGDISKPHTHPGAQLSGVYYVSTQEKSKWRWRVSAGRPPDSGDGRSTRWPEEQRGISTKNRNYGFISKFFRTLRIAL